MGCSAEWAQDKGLYASVHEDAASLDEAVDKLAKQLADSNPEAMAELKKNFWVGTEHWNMLLAERSLVFFESP